MSNLKGIIFLDKRLSHYISKFAKNVKVLDPYPKITQGMESNFDRLWNWSLLYKLLLINFNSNRIFCVEYDGVLQYFLLRTPLS